MSEEPTPKPSKPKAKARWGRILGVLLLLSVAGAVAYGLSWFNARRYYLIVDATKVRIGKGRMLPVGHEPFVPRDPALRAAYLEFPLPGGTGLDRGERIIDDRVELDQALYRVLDTAARRSVVLDNAKTPELLTIYLDRLRALPGLNAAQRSGVDELAAAALFIEAKGHESAGAALLEKAAAQFKKAGQAPDGPRAVEAVARTRRIEQALRALQQRLGSIPTPSSAAAGGITVPTTSTATGATR